jgi:two-component system phosphate regulon sensor histidine kinase PhoR
MVFKKFPAHAAGPIPNPQHFFFGFQLSTGFLNSARIFSIFSRFMEKGLRLAVLPDKYRQAGLSADREQDFPLLTVGLEKFFPGRSLALISSERNFFARRAREEIRLNYLLMGAFILVLILGIYLFYKYLSREAELVRLKSEFTDQASHSLKTPLTRIRMLAEKLQLGWVSSETKKQEYLRTILTETDRMNEMIVNMLDFSKIEAGRKQYHFEQKSLPLVVQEVLEDYSPYIRNLGFQWQVEIAADIPLFPLDAEAIKLILVNLLQNAFKYSPTEKSIKVRLLREEDSAVLTVEDRGIGIEEKDLKRIFARFYRSAAEAVQTVEGSGLGLFLVQHAVQAHRGRIDVTCLPGKGSVFKVSLPLGLT